MLYTYVSLTAELVVTVLYVKCNPWSTGGKVGTGVGAGVGTGVGTGTGVGSFIKFINVIGLLLIKDPNIEFLLRYTYDEYEVKYTVFNAEQ